MTKVHESEMVLSEKSQKSWQPYTPEKIIGVGLLGAVSGIIIYYLYNQMSDDAKKVVKDAVVTSVKAQMAKMAIND